MLHKLKRIFASGAGSPAAPLPSGASLRHPPILINSIAKSGTHMAAKFLSLAGLVQKAGFDAGIGQHIWKGATAPLFLHDMRLKDYGERGLYFGSTWLSQCLKETLLPYLAIEQGSFATTHMLYSEAMRQLVEQRGLKMLVIVRQPVAIALSTTDWIMTTDNGPLTAYYQSLTPDERHYCSVMGSDEGGILPLKTRFLNMMHWLKHPWAEHVAFHEMIGPKGGGSEAIQRQTFQKLARFMEKDDLDEAYIAQRLFGDTPTFRQGKIMPDAVPEVFSSKEIAPVIRDIESLPVFTDGR